MTNLKWYVTWYSECSGWAVMFGEFRDSWHEHKYEADARRDWLNLLDQQCPAP